MSVSAFLSKKLLFVTADPTPWSQSSGGHNSWWRRSGWRYVRWCNVLLEILQGHSLDLRFLYEVSVYRLYDKIEIMILSLFSCRELTEERISRGCPCRHVPAEERVPRQWGNPPPIAVETISLAIQRNECFGLLGPNGMVYTVLFLIIQHENSNIAWATPNF